jgi:hypothetical protein
MMQVAKQSRLARRAALMIAEVNWDEKKQNTFYPKSSLEMPRGRQGSSNSF